MIYSEWLGGVAGIESRLEIGLKITLENQIIFLKDFFILFFTPGFAVVLRQLLDYVVFLCAA